MSTAKTRKNKEQIADQEANAEMFAALEMLEKEKGIPQDYMLTRIEAALTSAYKRETKDHTNISIELNKELKMLRIYQVKTVAEEVEDDVCEMTVEAADLAEPKIHHAVGDVVRFPLRSQEFRRLSATTAKQVIVQGIREFERDRHIREYEERREEIITATVERIDMESGNVLVDTGTSHATLLKEEQIPGETFLEGQRIKVFVMEVKHEARGPIVTLSRTHPGFVKRLFELNVPEIQDGTVIIKNITREPGSRSKMSVESRDENVDPIGSCIGQHNMRISAILAELSGEKIDLIKYSEDEAEYIRAALAPAVAQDVIIDGERSCRVIVAPDQLSLAIGKEGQNARLAARLTGFKIDIKTE